MKEDRRKGARREPQEKKRKPVAWATENGTARGGKAETRKFKAKRRKTLFYRVPCAPAEQARKAKRLVKGESKTPIPPKMGGSAPVGELLQSERSENLKKEEGGRGKVGQNIKMQCFSL